VTMDSTNPPQLDRIEVTRGSMTISRYCCLQDAKFPAKHSSTIVNPFSGMRPFSPQARLGQGCLWTIHRENKTWKEPKEVFWSYAWSWDGSPVIDQRVGIYRLYDLVEWTSVKEETAFSWCRRASNEELVTPPSLFRQRNNKSIALEHKVRLSGNIQLMKTFKSSDCSGHHVDCHRNIRYKRSFPAEEIGSGNCQTPEQGHKSREVVRAQNSRWEAGAICCSCQFMISCQCFEAFS
jgi:hypothetical protein